MSAQRPQLRRGGSAAPPVHPRRPRAPRAFCEVYGGCDEVAAVWFRGHTLFGDPVTLWACEDHQLEFRLRHPEMSWGESKF